MQNRARFCHFLPKPGRIRHKIDVFSPERPTPICRQMVKGFHERPAGWFTDMAKLRKLTRGFNYPLSPPIRDFGGKPVLQTNGLSERMSVIGRFWGYQILPNFTIFYQKCVAKGVRTGSKRQLTRGFSRPILLKRVKSGGSCQAVSLSYQLSVIGYQFSVFSSIEPPTCNSKLGTED